MSKYFAVFYKILIHVMFGTWDKICNLKIILSCVWLEELVRLMGSSSNNLPRDNWGITN